MHYEWQPQDLVFVPERNLEKYIDVILAERTFLGNEYNNIYHRNKKCDNFNYLRISPDSLQCYQ